MIYLSRRDIVCGKRNGGIADEIKELDQLDILRFTQTKRESVDSS